MRTLLLNLIFIGIGLAQYPLDIINNNVVGAAGIWVGTTSLEKAQEYFAQHDYVALNFTYDQPWVDGGDAYFAAIKMNGISMYWSIVVKGGIVTKVFIKTLIDPNPLSSEEEILVGLYQMTIEDRTQKLGNPHTEIGNMKGWSFSQTSYDLLLVRNGSGVLQMTEAIYLKP